MPIDEIAAEAERRHALHVDHPTHRPLSDGYELVGLRGEQALADALGGEVDLSSRPDGDGGTDLVLAVLTHVRVDVKCARKAYNLIVEQGKVKPWTVYVLASYSDAEDKAKLIGWEWGAIVEKAPVRAFGHGVQNHYIPADKLRPMTELRAKAIGAHQCSRTSSV